MIDERVVGVNERQVHLRHEQVRVVPRIADHGGALGVPEHIAAALAGQQLGGIIPAEQERMADRTVAIEALEVQRRRACVLQLRRIQVGAQRQSVSRDVVGDELPEERPPGRFRAERCVGVHFVAAVAQPSAAPERVEERLVRAE